MHLDLDFIDLTVLGGWIQSIKIFGGKKNEHNKKNI